MKEAGEFVDGVRATVFWGQVKRTLQGADAPDHADLFRGEMRSSGKREDLRAGVDGKQFRVAPALALERGSEILSGAVSRMERENATVEGDERQVIVIPDISQEDEAPGGNPKIVTLLNLRKILEEA